MSKFTVFLLCLCPFSISAQSDTTIWADDFNHDGFIDSMYAFSYFGSGMSSDSYILIDGKSKKQYETSNERSFGEFFETYIFPKALYQVQNQSFRLVLEKAIIHPDSLIRERDSSLDWLLRLYQNLGDTLNKKQLKRVYPIPLKWHSGAPTISKNSRRYGVKLPFQELQTLNRHTHQIDSQAVVQLPPTAYGILKYYPHCHFLSGRRERLKSKMTYITESKPKIVYTDHGIYWLKDGKHAWLFVNDLFWVHGPWKLRWSSIGKILVGDDYLILSTNGGPTGANSVYVISLKTGYIGLVDSFDEATWIEGVSVDKDILTIAVDRKEEPASFGYSIKKLLKGLN